MAHGGVAFGQGPLRGARWNKPEVAGYCGVVVDPLAAGIVLTEENRLVACDRQHRFAICQSTSPDSGVVEADEVVPVPRPSLASDATLKAVDVHRRGLFPNRSLRKHYSRPGFREPEVGQHLGGVLTMGRTI